VFGGFFFVLGFVGSWLQDWSFQMSGTSQTVVQHGASGGSSAGQACACPECEGAIRFDRPPLRSQVVRCVSCGVELEVIETAPVQLALAPEVEEDWGE
jgi:alpha-aminoadipate carrier protein LysW